MRVLLDSSVLIAAYISRAGVCAELLEDVLMDHELITSLFILDEVSGKLLKKFRFPAESIAEIRASIVSSAECVTPTDIPAGSCRDAEDIPVLGSALAGKVELLITVDKDLLDLGQFEGIAIVKPGEFWRRAADRVATSPPKPPV